MVFPSFNFIKREGHGRKGPWISDFLTGHIQFQSASTWFYPHVYSIQCTNPNPYCPKDSPRMSDECQNQQVTCFQAYGGFAIVPLSLIESSCTIFTWRYLLSLHPFSFSLWEPWPDNLLELPGVDVPLLHVWVQTFEEFFKGREADSGWP